MKYFISVFLFALFPIMGFSQTEEEAETFNHHCLFEEKSVTLGLGTSYSFGLDVIGLNSRVYYNHGEHICLGPEFSFFKNDEEEVYDFNLVAHYIFETKIAGLYPIIGINYTIEEDAHHSQKEMGSTFGAGIHRNFNTITFFAEYTTVQSILKDNFTTMGLMINIK